MNHRVIEGFVKTDFLSSFGGYKGRGSFNEIDPFPPHFYQLRRSISDRYRSFLPPIGGQNKYKIPASKSISVDELQKRCITEPRSTSIICRLHVSGRICFR